MSPRRFLPLASFLLLLQGSVSLTASGARRSPSVSSHVLRHHDAAQERQQATRLAAFSSPASNLSCGLFSSCDKERNPSNYNHRHSASDWLHNVHSLPKSTVLRDIQNPVITVALWGTAVAMVHKLMASCGDRIVQKVARDMCIGSTPHSFLVSSLGLLLVFRTNSAYQRFAVRSVVVLSFSLIWWHHDISHF